MKKLTKTLRSMLPYLGVPAALIALLTIGPCATKDYVTGVVQMARAASERDLSDHRDADKEFRSEIRTELREIRCDIKKLLEKSGSNE